MSSKHAQAGRWVLGRWNFASAASVFFGAELTPKIHLSKWVLDIYSVTIWCCQFSGPRANCVVSTLDRVRRGGDVLLVGSGLTQCWHRTPPKGGNGIPHKKTVLVTITTSRQDRARNSTKTFPLQRSASFFLNESFISDLHIPFCVRNSLKTI